MTRRIALVMLAAGLVACTSKAIIRSRAGETCSVTPGKSVTECALYSIEEHRGQLAPHRPEEVDFMLGVVEFSDQGWLQNPAQLDGFMRRIEQEAGDQPVVLVVYVHGWKHNADVCDTNLACFREVLRMIRASELRGVAARAVGQERSPRKVIGVYVGWRGLSVDAGPLRNISFYTRKEAALHVAQGSARELFARLRDFQSRQNAKNPDSVIATRLVLIGHSFGALVVYHAVSQFLMESATGQPTEIVESYGDLVILVNAAFEASRYEPLHRQATGRADYNECQQPAFVAVTSKADWATKVTFPVGRWLGTRIQALSFIDADERDATLNTPGHLKRYRTHSLTVAAGREAAAGQPEGKPCACPYGGLANEFPDEKVEAEAFRAFREDGGYRKARWSRTYSRGAFLQRLDGGGRPENPIWMVEADEKVIAGHNEIYAPIFVDFVRQFYDDLVRGLAICAHVPRGGRR
jgi:hypothetical protein